MLARESGPTTHVPPAGARTAPEAGTRHRADLHARAGGTGGPLKRSPSPCSFSPTTTTHPPLYQLALPSPKHQHPHLATMETAKSQSPTPPLPTLARTTRAVLHLARHLRRRALTTPPCNPPPISPAPQTSSTPPSRRAWYVVPSSLLPGRRRARHPLTLLPWPVPQQETVSGASKEYVRRSASLVILDPQLTALLYPLFIYEGPTRTSPRTPTCRSRRARPPPSTRPCASSLLSLVPRCR